MSILKKEAEKILAGLDLDFDHDSDDLQYELDDLKMTVDRIEQEMADMKKDYKDLNKTLKDILNLFTKVQEEWEKRLLDLGGSPNHKKSKVFYNPI